jgi:23S rRNA pseudouridine955/2504/2580 synthase
VAKFKPFQSWILFEDEDYFFINKPDGISSLEERGGNSISVQSLAKNYHADAQLCHRIDKETSGILLIAKHPAAYRQAAMLFEARKILKVYHAIVQGVLQVANQEIILPLAQARNGLAKVDKVEGKFALTVINTLQIFRQHTLVACMPITGRLHQIRIHLASQNFPLMADESYGGKKTFLSNLKKGYKTSKWEVEKPMINRVALHASRLCFEADGKTYDVIAPYPKDFEVLLLLLQKHDNH